MRQDHTPHRGLEMAPVCATATSPSMVDGKAWDCATGDKARASAGSWDKSKQEPGWPSFWAVACSLVPAHPQFLPEARKRSIFVILPPTDLVITGWSQQIRTPHPTLGCPESGSLSQAWDLASAGTSTCSRACTQGPPQAQTWQRVSLSPSSCPGASSLHSAFLPESCS